LRPTSFFRASSVLLLALFAAVPMLGAVAADITLPVTGTLKMHSDLIYKTELTITNHRDVTQYVLLEIVNEGHYESLRGFPLQARETKFLPEGGFPSGPGWPYRVGAMRIRAVTDLESMTSDPLGQIEANAFIVADHPYSHGASRQEVAGIPSQEYEAKEAVFLGVRHSPGTGAYTNVGITNLHPTRTVTFSVEYEYLDPVTVVVPPLALRQIRISGPGNGGRMLRITPDWATTNGVPAPWVAYTSTVDTHTGDAFSGMRVPASSYFDR
jgi:hypothetical protein